MLLVSAKGEGNTFGVLERVAERIEAPLVLATDAPRIEGHRVILFGSGVYGGMVHKNLEVWVNGLDEEELRTGIRFYLLLTWIGRGHSDRSAFRRFSKTLAKRSLALESDYRSCYASFGRLIRKGHPDAEDIRAMETWALRLSASEDTVSR